MEDATAWDHIATAEHRIQNGASQCAIAYALISIARSLASIDEREGREREDLAL